ncbi:MAG: type II toxin-antitoxin system VapC family toxin [Phycisphaerae bacterium]|nr:type II toxin-antitoxin system VapC family toxin [Phycisphaerae bacterium]
MIFLDTSYLAALALGRDSLHGRAHAWSMCAAGSFVTTEYVLCEFANLLSAPSNRGKAHALLRSLEGNPHIEIVWGTSELFRQGSAMHAERTDKAWSLTDCISFVVMRQRGVAAALTYDHHFEQAGFEALLRREPPT